MRRGRALKFRHLIHYASDIADLPPGAVTLCRGHNRIIMFHVHQSAHQNLGRFWTGPPTQGTGAGQLISVNSSVSRI